MQCIRDVAGLDWMSCNVLSVNCEIELIRLQSEHLSDGAHSRAVDLTAARRNQVSVKELRGYLYSLSQLRP